jgi:hypothetical protein
MARKLEQKYSFGGTNHEYKRNKNLGRGTNQEGLHGEHKISLRNESWLEKLEQKYSAAEQIMTIEGTKI